MWEMGGLTVAGGHDIDGQRRNGLINIQVRRPGSQCCIVGPAAAADIRGLAWRRLLLRNASLNGLRSLSFVMAATTAAGGGF